MKKSMLLVSLVSSVIAITAAQAHAQKGPRLEFADIDADGSGSLSADEMSAARANKTERMIARLDTDEDGSISEEEWDNRPVRQKNGKRKAPDFADLDVDGNGLISSYDLETVRTERAEKMLSLIDTDGNGEVSEDEWDNRPKRRKGESFEEA